LKDETRNAELSQALSLKFTHRVLLNGNNACEVLFSRTAENSFCRPQTVCGRGCYFQCGHTDI